MSARVPDTTLSFVHPDSTFDRIVVGIDGSGPGFEACRQAAALVAPAGELELVCVTQRALAAHTGMLAAQAAAEIDLEGRRSLARAAEIAGEQASRRLLDGSPVPVLLGELARTKATLLAVGSHGHRRLTELLLGGVAGELLHRASCSVLVARSSPLAEPFPRTLVVGVDGSTGSERALAVARTLATRFGSSVRPVAALRCRDVDLVRVHADAHDVDEIDAHPADALVHASSDADLLLVGSRGLRGVRALGSVSERVAHAAACSVLVVREVEAA
jgi:nucleotide-binding universal stress UspA family protein